MKTRRKEEKREVGRLLLLPVSCTFETLPTSQMMIHPICVLAWLQFLMTETVVLDSDG